MKVVWVSKCVVLGQITGCTEFMRTVDRYRELLTVTEIDKGMRKRGFTPHVPLGEKVPSDPI